MRKLIRNSTLIITICILAMILMMTSINVAYADSFNITSDGVYSVPITTDMKMGADNFSSNVKVEKIDANYYMTFSVLDNTSISNLKLISGEDKIGEVIKTEGNVTNHTYTLNKAALQGDLNFKAFINAMKKEVSFTIKLNLSSASRTSETLDKKTERPAMYIPIISVNAGDTIMEKGSTYNINPASAKILGEDVPVEVKAYYVRNDNKQLLDIVKNKISLDNVGEYHIVYRAESDKYKTNLGNNTYSEHVIIIKSQVGATSLARIENIDGKNVLPEGSTVQAGRVKEESNIYLKAKTAMEKIADNFEIINVTIFDEAGNEPKLSDNIALYLNANNMYDRSEIVVYKLNNDGSIKEIACSPYGRYVRLETKEVGNYIVCVPGVKFVMPMWGYGCIALSVLPVLIVIIMAIVCPIVKKKKEIKKQEAIANGTYVEKPKKEKVKKEKVKKEKKTKK